MSEAKTLLEMAGAPTAPGAWSNSVLVMIDCQREYVDGALPLHGVGAALDEGARLIEAARRAVAPVIHVAHHSPPGAGLFDPEGPNAEIMPQVAPAGDEPTVIKGKPNAFAGTELNGLLQGLGRMELIIGGFMTHMCVSSTVRAALDLGYRCTVVDRAVATRDLPDGHGGVIDASALHRASLAALADRFAVVAPDAAAIPD